MNASSPPPNVRPADHPQVLSGRIGVLIVALGTPEGTDYWSMRRYLKEFLSDRRVIELNPLIWWPLLNGIILSRRPQAKGKDYASIWNKERDEGPLRTITRATAEKLAAATATGGRDPKGRCIIDYAMRYGKPAVGERLKSLLDRGCDRILLVPMYPQYAAATTATVCDVAFDALKAMRRQPTLRVAAPYFDEPVYIDALADSIRAHIAKLDFTPDAIVASFHGIPQSYFDKGDPYYCHCAKTTRLLRERLQLPPERLLMTFQSRFGRGEWLKPATDETLKGLPANGIKKLVVVTPGFSADCLETLEEICVENAHYFRDAGGENYSFVPCLNDEEGGIAVLDDLLKRELSGWL